MAKKKEVDLEIVKGLALSGHTHMQIAIALNISRALLYKNKDIIDTIREAEQELRQKVAKDLIARSSGDLSPSVSIWLAKRLNLYTASYTMPQIRTVKSALTQISRINKDLAAGEIPPELAASLIKNIDSFIKAFEVSELAEAVEKIQEQLNDQKKFS